MSHYSTGDPFVAAYLRLQGAQVMDLRPDPDRRDKYRIHMDLAEDEGLRLELEYRNSDFRGFVDLHRDTMDMVKRR